MNTEIVPVQPPEPTASELTVEIPAAIEGVTTDATNDASQANGRIKSLFGTSAVWRDALPTEVVQHVKSLSNEELFPMGEAALRDIADNLVVLAEIRDRFHYAHGALMGYANWKEFVAKNSAYSIRTIQQVKQVHKGIAHGGFWEDLYHRLNALVPAVSDSGTGIAKEHIVVSLLQESLNRTPTTQAEKNFRESILTMPRSLARFIKPLAGIILEKTSAEVPEVSMSISSHLTAKK